MQNTSTITAREHLAHAQAMLLIAEAAWLAKGRESYSTDPAVLDLYSKVQKWQADVVLWQRVIENADAWTSDEILEREG
jgi:hypothetical protein